MHLMDNFEAGIVAPFDQVTRVAKSERNDRRPGG